MLEQKICNLREWNEENIKIEDQFQPLIDNTSKTSLETEIEVLKQRGSMNLLDAVKHLLSEEGVKSYIVTRILELFNERIAYYLAKMNAKCVCYFNEMFEEVIINERKKVCSYHNFSGAERKDIDFACLFAFMDIRRYQSNVAYNISMYDELFDSSLDEQGINQVVKILKERAEKNNESIYIISHRKESIAASNGEVVFLEKSKGITKRVEFDSLAVDLL